METALLTILTILVAVLAGLLYLRIRREKAEAVALSKMVLPDSGEFMKSAMPEGDYQEVAVHLFDLLRDSCGCARIIYLQRQNAYLELTLSHGIDVPEPELFSIPCTADLVTQLTHQAAPGLLEELTTFLPAELVERLNPLKCDLYLPLLAQDRLNGIYFVSGNRAVRSLPFRLVLSSIAQTVSAAGHIRLIEAERHRLRERVRELENGNSPSQSEKTSPNRLLRLVHHRDSETLVGRIIDEVSRDLSFDRWVFLYPSGEAGSPVKVYHRGDGIVLEPPDRHDFEHLMSRLAPDKLEEVPSLPVESNPSGLLASSLKQAGLAYAAEFPLSSTQSGVLAFNCDGRPDEVVTVLRGHGLAATELMANAASFAEVEALSYTDGLTGLANRRYFRKRLDEEIGRAARYGRTLALIIFDLDELKVVNDSYGHQAGDSIIEQMGETLRESTRSIDVVARYGGDEFCIIMPESDRTMCGRFMARLQRRVSSAPFRLAQLDRKLACTISQGGAVFPDDGDTSEKLIYAADMALLRAKEGGRDQFHLS